MPDDLIIFRQKPEDGSSYTATDDLFRKASNDLMNKVSYDVSFDTSNSVKDADIPDSGGNFDGSDVGFVEGADFFF